jgi:hypothetical protein
MLLGVAALGFLAMVGVKLVPPYLEFSTVKSIMGEAASDPSLAGKGRREVLSSIEKKLYINDINVVSAADFEYKQGKRGDDLSVAYEVRRPLVGNLDAVMRFQHQVVMGNQ